MKLGHADDSTGGIGTGRALNTSQVLCLDTTTSQADGTVVVATGWIDGIVRVFEVPRDEFNKSSVAFSLLYNANIDDDLGEDGAQERPEPLVLNGHMESPVCALCLETTHTSSTAAAATRLLASGSSNGTVIVWDLIAESGLFRLLGHNKAITNLHFYAKDVLSESAANKQYLLSASLDGLLKIWDLQGQCCIQTLANMRGEIWASSLLHREVSASSEEEEQSRCRLLVGSMDGQVRVWNVGRQQKTSTSTETTDTTSTTAATATTTSGSNEDELCHDMGYLEAPQQHLATSSSKLVTSHMGSKERVIAIRYSPNGRHVGVLQANAKSMDIYAIKSHKEATRKKQRRLRRRQEKLKKKQREDEEEDDDENDASGKKKGGKKRGILDDDVGDDDQKDNDAAKGEPQSSLQTLDPEEMKASDEFEYLGTIKANHKIKAFVFFPHTHTKQNKTIVQVACALSTNTMELYALERQPPQDAATPLSRALVVSTKGSNVTPLYGHPTGVRAMALSTNDEMVVTVSKNYCKLWKVDTRSCLLSMALEQPVPINDTSGKAVSASTPNYQGLCSIFLPGNTHVVVGTKEGHLLILDTAASEVVYWEEKAHDDAIWSIDLYYNRATMTPDNLFMSTSIVTGSADKTVKFWSVEKQKQPGGSKKDDASSSSSDSDDDDGLVFFPGAPMLFPSRVLEMTDEVVAVKFSHARFSNEKRRLLFVSTLDCTIKVFFEDSLKLFLSLYGHKLPALAVDASDDDVLLVSASADKTIKLWGLDFGDTHRTLHGHGDSVTDVQFVRGTHNFFSASKDGTVRFWDGDRFEPILVLYGHNAEVNCLVVSAKNNGAFVLSGGMDRQVRVWERTKDIVFLEEERERELEKMFDDPSNRRDEGGTANILDRKGRSSGTNEEDDEMKQNEPQSEAAVKQNLLSIAAGDRLLEALELADEELQASRGKSGANRSANPMLLGMEPAQYILWVLRSIKSSDLEQALLILPLGHAERLLYYLVLLLRTGHTSAAELCSRVAVFTIKTHQNAVRSLLWNCLYGRSLVAAIAMRNDFTLYLYDNQKVDTKSIYTQVSEPRPIYFLDHSFNALLMLLSMPKCLLFSCTVVLLLFSSFPARAETIQGHDTVAPRVTTVDPASTSRISRHGWIQPCCVSHDWSNTP